MQKIYRVSFILILTFYSHAFCQAGLLAEGVMRFIPKSRKIESANDSLLKRRNLKNKKPCLLIKRHFHVSSIAARNENNDYLPKTEGGVNVDFLSSKGFVRQASMEDKDKISRLRIQAYEKAKEFSLLKSSILEWSEEDGEKIVLAAYTLQGEIISTMRGGFIHTLEQAEKKFECKIDNNTVRFPALCLDRAATDNVFKEKGLHSILRYYFLKMASEQRIENVLGQVYEGAPRTLLMQRLGYDMYPITYSYNLNHSYQIYLEARRQPLMAVLQREKFITAQQILLKEIGSTFEAYPWQGEPLKLNRPKSSLEQEKGQSL